MFRSFDLLEGEIIQLKLKPSGNIFNRINNTKEYYYIENIGNNMFIFIIHYKGKVTSLKIVIENLFKMFKINNNSFRFTKNEFSIHIKNKSLSIKRK